MFLACYENCSWKDAMTDWVEEKQDGAVEVIATRADGVTLAIEHTIVQPFVGEKRDSVEFMEAFGRIHKNPVLALPERLLTVIVQVGAIPKGYDRDAVGAELLAWLSANHGIAPLEGHLEQTVTVCSTSKLGPLPLLVGLQTMHIPGVAGSALISRGPMPKDFGSIVEEALRRKLPKLVKTNSDRHILLLELQHISMGDNQIIEEIEALGPAFPELAKVDEIWLVNTSILESDGCAYFWPLGRGPVELMRFENGILKHRRYDRHGINSPVV
jgi:hypothetical protein